MEVTFGVAGRNAIADIVVTRHGSEIAARRDQEVNGGLLVWSPDGQDWFLPGEDAHDALPLNVMGVLTPQQYDQLRIDAPNE